MKDIRSRLGELPRRQPVHEHRNQKHAPIGIHCIQENAAAVVLATISGVVIAPVCPVAGNTSAAAKKKDTRRDVLTAGSPSAMLGSIEVPPPDR